MSGGSGNKARGVPPPCPLRLTRGVRALLHAAAAAAAAAAGMGASLSVRLGSHPAAALEVLWGSKSRVGGGGGGVVPPARIDPAATAQVVAGGGVLPGVPGLSGKRRKSAAVATVVVRPLSLDGGPWLPRFGDLSSRSGEQRGPDTAGAVCKSRRAGIGVRARGSSVGGGSASPDPPFGTRGGGDHPPDAPALDAAPGVKGSCRKSGHPTPWTTSTPLRRLESHVRGPESSCDAE